MSGVEPGGQMEKPENAVGLKAPPLAGVPPTNNSTTVSGGMQRGKYLCLCSSILVKHIIISFILYRWT